MQSPPKVFLLYTKNICVRDKKKFKKKKSRIPAFVSWYLHLDMLKNLAPFFFFPTYSFFMWSKISYTGCFKQTIPLIVTFWFELTWRELSLEEKHFETEKEGNWIIANTYGQCIGYLEYPELQMNQ